MRHHPDAVAALLRQQSTWQSLEERGSRAHDADSWEDAAAALAGASALASAAYLWTFCNDAASRRVLETHLLSMVSDLSNGIAPAVLVALALDEQLCPTSQRKDSLRALVLGVPADTWDRRYRRVHARLLATIDELTGDAWRVIRGRIE